MAGYVNMSGVNIANVLNGSVNKVYGCDLPAVTKDTFGSLASQLRRAPDRVQNAWHDGLVDLVGLQIIMNKRVFESYFRKLHLGEIPTFDVQLIMLDLIKARAYSAKADSDDFFEDAPVRVKAQYANSILQAKFPVSYNEESLYGALTSEGAFMSYVEALESTLYSSLEMADVGAVKALINKNLEEGNIYLVVSTQPVDKDSALAFTKDVKALSADMEVEMTPRYNLSGMNTWTPKEDGVIITDTETEAITETYSLAWAFNKDYLSLKEGGQGITMQSGSLAGGKVFGLYGDRFAFQIRNIIGFPKVKRQEFGNTLTIKRWLHYWALYTISYFSNLVAFTSKNALTSPQSITLGSEKYGQIPGHFGSTEQELNTTYVHIDRGGDDRFYVDTLTFPSGTANPLFDKFGTWTATGASAVYDAQGAYYSWQTMDFTDSETAIDPITGDLHIGKNETCQGFQLVFTSHLDSNQMRTERGFINGNYTPTNNAKAKAKKTE